MKKIVGISLLIILISYLLLLSKYLVIEEILGFYLLPILLVIIVASLLYLLIWIFKKISYKKFITNFLIVACILQVLVGSLILWSATPRFISRSQVISDIDYAIKVTEDVHPDLYSIVSKNVFYSKTDSIKKTIPEKVSDVEVYKIFSRIFAQIKDGHTKVVETFYYRRGAQNFRKTLPYKFHIENDRIFVSKNLFYRNTIPVGSEIIKINGKPTSQCIQEISQLISYENTSFRNFKLQAPVLWGLWNNFKDFEISYKSPDSKTTNTIKTSGGLISKFLLINENKSGVKNYDFRIITGNIGYMEFNAFEDFDKFKTFLDSTFSTIKVEDVKNLIIDIRKNPGGNSSLGDELMQYISETNFRTFDSVNVKISNELTSKGMFNWIDSTKRKVGSIYKEINTSKTSLRNNPLRYIGNSYLLIGGNTFSSAVDFASVFQCYNAGKLIGTETGGLTVCFGDLYKFELPNTKIVMDVSYKKFYNACGIDNRQGIIPDYIVNYSLEDNITNVDRVLEFTIDLIKKE